MCNNISEKKAKKADVKYLNDAKAKKRPSKKVTYHPVNRFL